MKEGGGSLRQLKQCVIHSLSSLVLINRANTPHHTLDCPEQWSTAPQTLELTLAIPMENTNIYSLNVACNQLLIAQEHNIEYMTRGHKDEMRNWNL
jgi:hypothetical protein